jgi:2-dehydropantoate 2-reductase
MFESSEGRQLVRTLMDEVASVASAVGIELPVSVERRMAGAAAVGDHKTSMLQDLEAKKPLELEAVLGAVIELAGDSDVSVPALRVLYGLAKMREVNSRRQD